MRRNRPAPSSPASPPSQCEIASWLLSAAALFLVLRLGLLSGLLSGLLVYELVHLFAGRLPERFAGKYARIAAVALLAALVVSGIAAAILGAAAFFRSDWGSFPALLRKMSEIVEGSKSWLPASVYGTLPGSADEISARIAAWLRTHAGEVRSFGERAGRTAVHILVGMAVGAIVSLRGETSRSPRRPLTRALSDRATHLGEAFRNVVFAQLRISAVNTVATALYLVVLLPLFGVRLPFPKTLVALAFVTGLLPVVGNLLSNGVIVVIALGHSLPAAAASLAFLAIVHKAEYFLNARIVGVRIGAASWELLIAMFAMEAAFGVHGLVAAPVYYACLKSELRERGLA
jgi:predicted PurR-regulated permease PerM